MPTQDTKTAADLLKYQTYTNPGGQEKLSRSVNGLQEWLVKATDGQTFYIKFDKNFSKKHLVTESKKTVSTPTSLEAKITKLLTARSTSSMCECAHELNNHQHLPPGISKTKAKKNKVKPTQGQCKKCGGTCQDFTSVYSRTRITENKPDTNPLGGTPTSVNTCIILNRVPKEKFEDVVLQSILKHERPPHQWKKGDPLAMKDNDQVELEWEFGARNPNAVVKADLSKPPKQWRTYEGCKVKAVKLPNQPHPTWQVFHMEDVI